MCIAREDAAVLATLRLAQGIEVGESKGLIWLRSPQTDEGIEAKLACLPARGRYEWLASNQLRQLDQRIPSSELPKLSWQPLDAWLRVERLPAAFPAIPPKAIPLRLVRSTCECESQLLMTTVEELKLFAATAARVRLECLEFAANAEGHALVKGQPLPSLPGRRFVLHGGRVGVPSGFSWEPAVHAEVLVRSLSVSAEMIVLWAEDGSITRFHSEQFIRVSRSALHETERAILEAR